MKSTSIIERVINEDAEIYCERTGNGPLLLLIHGGMEDADSTPLQLTSFLENLPLYLMIGDATLAALEIEVLT
jgi:hypothetical protein